MRRRQFLACAALAGLAGCLGSESEDRAASDETPAGGTDWEPASTATSTTEGPGTQDSEQVRDPSEENTGSNGRVESENGGDGGRDGSEGAEALENGEDWQADRAQVVAENSGTGRAIEFELRTAPPQKCGRTCRKLRATLTNAGSETARDIAVRTTLGSGDSVLRERRDAVGDLPPGSTYRANERVELGPLEALRVRRNGAITIEQVVTSATRRELFRRRIEL
ncbi:hypothetical protein BRC86_11295 [Halobacteriales archaeon QS_3_64_16]|nr:MAG: hypothetical protein BRC86_11295 [Halobacteriales archaeon QS_3_64_16]